MLLVIGTTGGTNLPQQIARTCALRNVSRLVMDPRGDAFSDLPGEQLWLNEKASAAVPGVCEFLIKTWPPGV